MRIIYHHRTRLGDAQAIHIRAMIRAFRHLGHEVEVVALVESDRDDAARPKRLWRIETGRLPTWIYETLSLAYNLHGYRRLARALRRQGADLIYERYALNTFCGALASRRFGVPLLLEVNAPWEHHPPAAGQVRFRGLARRLERWLCSNSTHVIAVSAALKRELVERGVPERQVSVLHNAVDPVAFHPDVSGREVRERYGLDGHVVAGFVGWLRDWHGLEDLIDAICASGLLARGLRLMIVGSGPTFAAVQRRVRGRGLEAQVILTGAVAHQDVPAHVAALDIALQPRATAYACPMKLVEYMALARCIVAPDQPNVRELVSDGSSARLFAPGDHQGMVALISELMSAPGVRATLGRNAYQSVIERDLIWRANAARALGLLAGERSDGDLLARPAPGASGETGRGFEALRQR
jgi:glycosyltransferase involved in cell wall biosynthesis